MKVKSQTAWFMKSGNVRVLWRNQPLDLRSGQWAVFGTGRGPHRFSNDAELISICFRAEWPNGQAFFDDTHPIVIESNESAGLTRAATRLVRAAGQLAPGVKNRLIFQSSTLESYLKVRRAYYGWLTALAHALTEQGVNMRQVTPTDERVADAVRLLDDWPLHQPFTETAAAAAVGLSRPHFSRMFTAQLGLTAKAYYDQRRLRVARERLIAEDTPIKAIAYQLGFHDPAHFSHWFRKRTGSSPRLVRQGKASSWQMS